MCVCVWEGVCVCGGRVCVCVSVCWCVDGGYACECVVGGVQS